MDMEFLKKQLMDNLEDLYNAHGTIEKEMFFRIMKELIGELNDEI